MLTINATIENEKIILDSLRGLGRNSPDVLRRTLSRAAVGTYRAAFDKLSGSAGDTGGYPVPVVTGNLRGLLAWLNPGEGKEGIQAGNLEAIVYNTAEYAEDIHQGTGAHTKFGARPYLSDAFDQFNGSGRLEGIAAEELDKELSNQGFN